jgi:hypothetical protein
MNVHELLRFLSVTTNFVFSLYTTLSFFSSSPLLASIDSFQTREIPTASVPPFPLLLTLPHMTYPFPSFPSALRALTKPYKFDILPRRARPVPRIMGAYLGDSLLLRCPSPLLSIKKHNCLLLTISDTSTFCPNLFRFFTRRIFITRNTNS